MKEQMREAYLDLCEKGWNNSQDLFYSAYELGHKAALSAVPANHERFERQYYLELSKVEDLQVENAAQALRIFELEERMCVLSAGSRQQVYAALHRRYKEILSLRRESASLQKENAELKAEDEISAAVIEKCSNLLAQIAITIKGHPKELTRHSYHDLPELVSVMHVENELNKHQILEQANEIESLRKQSDEMLTAMRRAVLALAFAAEKSRSMQNDYQALSNAIDKAVSAQKGTE
jgi:hypothetical protein